MKKIFISILTVLVATGALVSCTKDINPGKIDVKPAEDGLYTIAVSFDSPTKTTLSGNRPHFDVNDKILISNEEESEVCTVELDGEQTVIRTKLEGPYVAVYPHTAALLDENNENRIIGVKVSAGQTGKFADANICMADQIHVKGMGTRTNALHFLNRVTILKFYVDKAIQVTSIKVIHNEGRNIANGSNTITVECPKDCKQLYDAMPKDKQDPRICYVAVQPENEETCFIMANDLTFEVETDTHGKVTKTPAAEGVSMEKNQMYNVFIPYHIDVQVGKEKQQWGYCNVGAFLPEEPGLFFAWGDIKGHKADFSIDATEDGEGFSIFNAFAEDFYFFDFDDGRYKDNEIDRYVGFSKQNAPYYSTGTETYTKYTGSDYESLQRSDDAATVNWGGKWRMPTKDEFSSLIDVTNTDVKSDIVGKCLQIRNTNLLFPAAGLGRNTKLQVYVNNGEEKYYIGVYGTRTYNNYSINNARVFRFVTGILNEMIDFSREVGFSIRPIYDETLPENDPVALSIDTYGNGGTL